MKKQEYNLIINGKDAIIRITKENDYCLKVAYFGLDYDNQDDIEEISIFNRCFKIAIDYLLKHTQYERDAEFVNSFRYFFKNKDDVEKVFDYCYVHAYNYYAKAIQKPNNVISIKHK